MNKYNYLYFLIIITIIFYIKKYYINSNKSEKIYLTKLNKLIDLKLNNNDKKLFIVPFIELGDNIIINGGIQYLSKIYTTIIYVCKKANYNQISYMYSNLSNIIYYIIPDELTINYLKYYLPDNDSILNKFKKYNIKYINFFNNISNNKISFFYKYLFVDDVVKRTYENLNMNIDIGYEYFKIPRNIKRENNMYNQLTEVIGEKYIVIIDDEKRNFLINDEYIKNLKLPIFKLSNNSKNLNKKLDDIKSEYIFDYIKILSNADTIFSIDTSMLWLIDFLNINTKIYAFCARNDTCIYRNKNIIKLDIKLLDILKTNINSSNYFIKSIYEYFISII